MLTHGGVGAWVGECGRLTRGGGVSNVGGSGVWGTLTAIDPVVEVGIGVGVPLVVCLGVVLLVVLLGVLVVIVRLLVFVVGPSTGQGSSVRHAILPMSTKWISGGQTMCQMVCQ